MSTKNRTPMMVWGDLVQNGMPIVRRTLVGNNAHECMYAWVYLTDFLLIKRISERIKEKQVSSHFDDYEKIIEAINNIASDREIDPHYQYNAEAWLIAYVVSSISQIADEKICVVELGQTFFALKNKVETVNSQLNSDQAEISWIGLDNSSFAVDVAKTLQKDDRIRYLSDWRHLKPNDIQSFGRSIFTSRFVSSYAFSSTEEFLNFLRDADFENIIIEEPFNIEQRDMKTFNHGLPILYFNVKAFSSFASENGYSVSVLGAYGDNPANSGRCINIRLLLSKNPDFLPRLNGLLSYFSGRGLNAVLDCADGLVGKFEELVSAEEWGSIDQFKKKNPVWGRTPASISKRRLKSRVMDILKYVFLCLKYGFIFKIHRGANVRQELVRHFGERYLKSRS